MKVSSKHAVSAALLTATLPFFFLTADKWLIDSLRSFLHEHASLDGFLKLIDPICYYLYHGTTQISAAFILFIAGKFLYRPMYIPGRTFLVSLCASGIAVQITKHLVGRARPRIADTFIAIGPSLHVDYDSFPSGHTALAFSIACILSSYFKRYAAVFYLFAALAGFDRVKTGSHFPSDVIAGAFTGIVVTTWLLPKLQKGSAALS